MIREIVKTEAFMKTYKPLCNLCNFADGLFFLFRENVDDVGRNLKEKVYFAAKV